jgi:hypothetical protein
MEVHLHTHILTSLLEGRLLLHDQAPLPPKKSPGLPIKEKARRAPQLVWAKKNIWHLKRPGAGFTTRPPYPRGQDPRYPLNGRVGLEDFREEHISSPAGNPAPDQCRACGLFITTSNKTSMNCSRLIGVEEICRQSSTEYTSIQT